MAGNPFITRPKFAFVIAIVISLAGLIAIPILPIAEFPQVTPPQVVVTTVYPGANAAVVQDAVASVIEDKVNGVDGMIYMASKCGNDGSYNLTVTFAIGTDGKLAEVAINNRVNQATAKLPEEVKRIGVTVKEKSASMALVVNLYAPDQTYDNIFLSNYADLNVKGELARIPGVSEVMIMGEMKYAMRVWLDPGRMASHNLSVTDVFAAIREQNVQVAPGTIGGAPAAAGQQDTFTLVTDGRLPDEEAFRDIVLRNTPTGEALTLGDVATVTLGSENYSGRGMLDNAACSVIAVYATPTANVVEISNQVEQTMARLEQAFPDGLAQDVLYDTAVAITVSLQELVSTLISALILVVLVVWIFMQDWRATLVPALAIPVSLIGTFGILLALGMTINTVSLFALILAIGVVVDDAIVVVENTQRWLSEGLSPREAARRTMQEVSGPVVATTLVLLAVFVPVMVMPGLTGRMYQQFAITISIAVVLSSINALSLSPALCASLLRKPQASTFILFRWFEAGFSRLTKGYMTLVTGLSRRLLLVGVAYVGILVATGFGFMRTPTGFVPLEDKGNFMIDVELPAGASLERTETALAQLTDTIREEPGVANVITVSGFSLLKGTSKPDSGLVIVILDHWDERPDRSLHQMAILQRVQARCNALITANARCFPQPPIPGIGMVAGQEMILQDRQARTPDELAAAMNAFILQANDQPELQKTYGLLRADQPQIYLDIDRAKAKAMQVSLDEVFTSLGTYLGSGYVNDFNRFGKVYQVKIQAAPEARADVSDIGQIFVRNKEGNMVPLSTLVTTSTTLAPAALDRYNLYNSAAINSQPAPGYSSGAAIAAMERVAAETLPVGFSLEWTGMTYQEIDAGNLAPILFSLAVVFVFLFLVAQYESWTIPIAVLMAVPVAMLGAILALQVLPMLGLNFYGQVGLVLLIGLSTKNAILVVEFAKQLREEEGKSIIDATLTAARLRFRAVLMTALSFVLGVIPLLTASGCGATSRISLGLVVFGGMVMASVLGTILVPTFYAMIQTIREKVKGPAETWGEQEASES